MRKQISGFTTTDGDLVTVSLVAEMGSKELVISSLEGEVRLPCEDMEALRDGVELAILQEPDVYELTIEDEIQAVEQSIVTLQGMKAAAEAVGTDQAQAKAEELEKRIQWRESRLERLRKV